MDGTTIQEIKDGDIFRWSYKIPPLNQRDPYWCKSRIAVARDGSLRDTYWGERGDEGTRWRYALALAALNLTFLGNFADLEPTDHWKGEYYDAADIVDVRHLNGSQGNFYVRKGAKRSAAKMLETANYKLEKAMDATRAANRDTERMMEAIQDIKAGKSLEEIWL